MSAEDLTQTHDKPNTDRTRHWHSAGFRETQTGRRLSNTSLLLQHVTENISEEKLQLSERTGKDRPSNRWAPEIMPQSVVEETCCFIWVKTLPEMY